MSVYLDHAATTPVTPGALQAYLETSKEIGNPSSVHSFGQTTRRFVEEAREVIAGLLGANRAEVIFTSGGTEANNLAIKGLYWERAKSDFTRNVIITAATEHHAVLEPIEWLVKHENAELVLVPISRDGQFDIKWLAEFLESAHARIALISLMWVNNETGVINDIPSVTKIANGFGIPVHSDAVAAFGHTNVSFSESGLAAMTVTGHKIGAPVGIGALLVSRQTKIESLQQGGGHERGFRSGTMNAAGAKSFAVAASEALGNLQSNEANWRALQDRLIREVSSTYPDSVLVGSAEHRVPNNLNFIFKGCSGDSLLFLLDRQGVAISNGAACSAGVASASHVLLGMGFDQQEASGCVRISFGFDTSMEDIDGFLRALPEAHAGAKTAGFVSNK